MALDTSKKGQYHSALAQEGRMTVKVLSDLKISRYNKPGESGYKYVELDCDGYKFTYSCENEDCAKAFKGRQGEEIEIEATGRDEDAEIRVSNAPPRREERRPEPQRERREDPPPRRRQEEEPLRRRPEDDPVRDAEHYLAQLSAGTSLVLKAARATRMGYELEFGQDSMTETQFGQITMFYAIALKDKGFIDKLVPSSPRQGEEPY